ncbi:hypothetical protein C2G38_2234311 [Gigaspora rosea]|uniref:Uncharacterized protein n=1 Tax=Gigaspora rosea TaxID=44941 RepID=A0A397TQP0_9GLOM|nr:hypothetical protein C2G38_2234311 [Gigaspora rosea]
MPPKTSSHELRSTKKKVDNIASRESDASEHSTDNLKSKRPRKSHQAKAKSMTDIT